MQELSDLAIIIPVGPEDHAWKILLEDLFAYSSAAEIILVGTDAAPKDCQDLEKRTAHANQISWLQTNQGRARQLNYGARSTQRKFIWFLHADSRVTIKALISLSQSLKFYPNDLLFFDLKFLSDGPKLTTLNTLGVWIRSHVFQLPFGDQGFCLAREKFIELGGFSEKATYGEDHLFVWAARKKGIRLRCTGETVSTSARKYQDLGWGKTTVLHSVLTARQAIPEGASLIAQKIRQKIRRGLTW
ncbi:MAG: glycosyltransferase [Bacteriovoracia bacterium]